MKKNKLSVMYYHFYNLLTVFLLCFFTKYAIAQNSSVSHEGIEVIGQAVVEITELSALKLLVIEEGVTASKTRLLVQQKSEQIIKGLANLGINKQDIQISELTVKSIPVSSSVTFDNVEVFDKKNGYPVKVNTKVKPEREQNKKKLIAVSREIVIDMKEEGLYERVYDEASKRGAKDIRVITFADNQHLYYEDALKEAIDNAKYKAHDLALKMGVELGDIISITEVSSPPLSLSSLNKSKSYQSNKADSSSYDEPTSVLAKVKVCFKIK